LEKKKAVASNPAINRPAKKSRRKRVRKDGGRTIGRGGGNNRGNKWENKRPRRKRPWDTRVEGSHLGFGVADRKVGGRGEWRFLVVRLLTS